MLKIKGTMNEELKKIREHIGRVVTHIAREHQTTDDVVWKQMLLEAACQMNAKHLKVI